MNNEKQGEIINKQLKKNMGKEEEKGRRIREQLNERMTCSL